MWQLAVFASMVAGPHYWGQWTHESVATAEFPGDSLGIACVAVRPDGQAVHAVYERWHGQERATRELQWSVRDTTQWSESRLLCDHTPYDRRRQGRTQFLPSLDLDSSGSPHVSYRRRCRQGEDAGCYDWTYNVVAHAELKGVPEFAWSDTTVAGLVIDQGSSSLRVDSQDRVHVSFRWKYTGDDDIGYNRRVDGQWDTPCTVMPFPLPQEHGRLALDPTGRPHIVATSTLQDSVFKRLAFAAPAPKDSPGGCDFGDYKLHADDVVTLPIQEAARQLDHAAIAIGGPEQHPNRVHIVSNANAQDGRHGLVYTWNDNPGGPGPGGKGRTAWHTRTLVRDGMHPSVAVDREGQLWLAYQGRSNRQAPFRVYVMHGLGDDWSRPVEVDPSPGSQKIEWADPAVAIDGSGRVHVVYNVDHVEVRHAWIDP